MYQPMDQKMKESKAKGMGMSTKRSPDEQKEFDKMK